MPRELFPFVEIATWGGFLFLLMPPSEDVDDSRDWLLLLSWRCPWGRLNDGALDAESGRDGIVSPRCNFASTSLPVTCRLRGVSSPPFLLLPLLPARCLFTLSLPSITFAGGGG